MTQPARHDPILVIGDAMLDRYWEGRVERISPEAPVPVLQVTRDFARAGGAANVALNLRALGSAVTLLTLLGDDDAGRELTRLLLEQQVALHGIGGSRHKTTQKIRCVSLRQQLLRTDFEEPACDECVMSLMAACPELLPAPGVVVLSDYAKGSLRHSRELIDMALRRGCTVLVDPKGRDFTRYRGAWLLKPNAAEMQAVVGEWADEADFRARCERLRAELRIEHLLVTRGDQGMTLLRDGAVLHLPAEVHEVYDVSGAGDTVLATLAHFVARGAGADEAVRWANKAAGVVVTKFGTASVTLDELGLAEPAPDLAATAAGAAEPRVMQ
jgi:D-glycero-beta-D-manno-heptose-7-phosphate kinase